MRKVVLSALGVVASAAVVMQAMSTPVDAAVSNPGAVTFVVDSLSIAIGSTTATYRVSDGPGCGDGVDDANDTDALADYPADTQCTSSTDDSETKAGFQPRVTPKMVGTVTANGAISVPASGVTLPVFYLENSSAGGDGVITIAPRAVQPVTGTITLETGVMSLRVRLGVDLDATNLPSACAIGSSTGPIDMNALATTTSGGSGYSATTGAATLVDRSYAVPASSGCSLAASAINSALGLPSAAGSNVATFVMHSTPVLVAGAAPTSSSPSTPPSTSGPSTSGPTTTRLTTTTRPPFTWFRTTTTVPRTTSTTRRVTTTTRPTTSTTFGTGTTTTTRPWWCTWCR